MTGFNTRFRFAGNLAVLVVLFKYPAKKFVPLNWLLCHLALADFIMGITVFWWYGVAEMAKLPVTNVVKVSVGTTGVVAHFELLCTVLVMLQENYFFVSD